MHIILDHLQIVSPPSDLKSSGLCIEDWITLSDNVMSQVESNAGTIQYLISNEAFQDFVNLGRYPHEEYFNSILKEHGLEEAFSAKDILYVIGHVYDRIDKLEDVFEVFSIGRSKNLNWYYSEDDLRNAFDNILLRVFSNVCNDEILRQMTAIWSPHLISSQMVDILLEIDVSEYANLVGQHVFQTKFVKEPNDIMDFIVPIELWRHANTATHIKLAICLEQRRRIAENPDQLTKINFSIGRAFFDSLRQNQCLGNGAFATVSFDTVCDLCTGSDSLDTGDFKIKKGNSMVPKIDPKRGRAKRAHITKGNNARRLMYWEKNGAVELANIGPKNELIIQ